LDWRVAWARAGIAVAATALVAVLALSGGAVTNPPVPRGFPGFVPAFMGGGDADGDRRWLARAQRLDDGAPAWARRMYRRSLLVLRALTDPHTGGAVAGAREGWAYVWPRDTAAVAIAFAGAGYRPEARRVARFLLSLDLEAAARFRATGEPVPARDAQGDAAGWVAAAARAANLKAPGSGWGWRGRADYQERDPGDYLGNAIASTGLPVTNGVESARLDETFGLRGGLVRIAGDSGSGLDSAAAWAVRPFRIEALYPAARRTLRRLAASSGRFGMVPSEDWRGGEDPWTAPTAWTAWALAALAHDSRAPASARQQDRRGALRLMATLRRTSTPLGLLPERVDARTGAPRSTTPLAWSHAFAILALRAIYRRRSRPR
jgi:glucoamylase